MGVDEIYFENILAKLATTCAIYRSELMRTTGELNLQIRRVSIEWEIVVVEFKPQNEYSTNNNDLY